MSGHSKWSQIKRQKGSEDAKRSRLFSRLGKQIALQSKMANGDIKSPSLRQIIEKAKKENMPKDTIERAIKKGAGGEASEIFNVTYEAYAQNGVAIVIFCETDNKNRTLQEIKKILSDNFAGLGSIGSSMWAFSKKESGEFEPNVFVEISYEDAEKLFPLLDTLTDHDDVIKVISNEKEI